MKETEAFYENKKLLPLGDLRFLNKRFSWQKSLAEMYEQNLLDLHLFQKDCKKLAKMVVDIELDKVGETGEVIDSIQTFWNKLILLLYRVNTRNNIVKISEDKRGVPSSDVQEFVETFELRLKFIIDNLYNNCSTHFYWLNEYLTSKEHSKKEMEILIWHTYSGFLDSAKEIANLNAIPAEDYFQFYEIEIKLKQMLTSILNEDD